MLIYVIGYYFIINLLTLLLIRYDKIQAKRSKRRVPEARFFSLSWIGGAVGILIGMRIFRHKTKHASFVYGIPVILLLHIAAAVGLYYYFR